MWGLKMEAKVKVKRVALSVVGLLALVSLLAIGCAPEVNPEEEVVSSCVSCHSDKDLLKQTAAPVEEVKSEETSGEG